MCMGIDRVQIDWDAYRIARLRQLNSAAVADVQRYVAVGESWVRASTETRVEVMDVVPQERELISA